MRDSQYKSCAVQNQFTAYLIAAIRNYKRTYLRRISTALRTELPMEGHSEVMELCEETDFFCGLPLMQRLENERLFAAMQGLSERERYIFLSKVLGEMSLSEIALSLGITYGAAAMSYHRTVLRLRNAIERTLSVTLYGNNGLTAARKKPSSHERRAGLPNFTNNYAFSSLSTASS